MIAGAGNKTQHSGMNQSTAIMLLTDSGLLDDDDDDDNNNNNNNEHIEHCGGVFEFRDFLQSHQTKSEYYFKFGHLLNTLSKHIYTNQPAI
jgi:hypothetical protein